AVLLGMWIAALVTLIVRSMTAAQTVRHLRRANRRDLVAAATSADVEDRLALAALMLDRIGLIAARLTPMRGESAELTDNAVTEVRIGIELVRLRRARRDASKEAAREIETILQAVARHFRSDAAQAPAELLERIDAGLQHIATSEKDPLRRDLLLALLQLRRGFFPDAEPYEPRALETRQSELAA
ncbi:MAG: FUSC family protein, partial [Hyphomicrobiales bacterium]|nr:FUSC family protein [Hyphomicrobiales bacterium]MBV8664445.1 FUSC family protein [Hyphomicrobiales bacterium]